MVHLIFYNKKMIVIYASSRLEKPDFYNCYFLCEFPVKSFAFFMQQTSEKFHE